MRLRTRSVALLMVLAAGCGQDQDVSRLAPAEGVSSTRMADGSAAMVRAAAPNVARRFSANIVFGGSDPVRTLIVYPYGGNQGVPPLATLASNGINATYHTGPALDAAVLANYDVVFVGRGAVIPFLRPAPLTINTADVVAWIAAGGTIVGETNSVGFDSDAWEGTNFSSTMRAIFGINTPNGGGDCGIGDMSVSINTAHPQAAGLPASFTIFNNGSFLAWQCGGGLNPGANPTVTQWGSIMDQPLTTSDYGDGCTVWLPAVGYGFLNWASQPDVTQMYVNALRGCGAGTGPSDDTPPSITANVSGTLGNNGWYTSPVSVTWTVTDDESDVTTDGCGPTTLSSDTPGQTLTCNATSDGGSASESVTIKIDQTAPSVTITGNAGSYTVDQTVNIGCAYSETLSGIAIQLCSGASGPAYSLGVGAHTVSGSATDNAGNTGTASGSFNVVVTSGSLCNLVKAWVSQHGIANSMCKQLENGALGAFQNHVRAQSGKSVTAGNAAILIGLADALMGS